MWEIWEQELNMPEGLRAADLYINGGLDGQIPDFVDGYNLVAVNPHGQKWLKSHAIGLVVGKVAEIQDVYDSDYQTDFASGLVVQVLSKASRELCDDQDHDSFTLLQQSVNDVMPAHYDTSAKAHKQRDAAKLIRTQIVQILNPM